MNKVLIPYVIKKKITNKKSLLLGYWCCSFNNDIKTKKFNIVKHPWENSKKYKKDYKKILNYYEIFLKKLIYILNKEHNTSYSHKFWEIFIGPWLFVFITTFYEKWMLTNKIKTGYIIKEKKNYNSIEVVKDHLEFKKKTLDDEWHQNLLLRILKKRNYKNFFLKKIIYKKNKKINSKYNFKEIFFFLIIKLFGYFKKKQKVVIFDTYLGKLSSVILNIKNFIFFPQFLNTNYVSKNINFKKRIILSFQHNNYESSFKKILTEEILTNIPLDFLENFNNVKKIVLKNNLPYKPRVILSSDGFYFNSIKTRYIADCLENGSKLMIMQHGGIYGHLKFNFLQEFEIRVSNLFLSWGWKEKNNSKIKKIGITKNINTILRNNNKDLNNSRCLFIVQDLRRHINNLTSLTSSKNFYEYYFKFCPEFIANLEVDVRNNLTLRFLSNISRWNAHLFLKKKFNTVKITIGSEEKYFDAIRNSKLVICSYLSTSFLECMAANVPVILILYNDRHSKDIYNVSTLNILSNLKENNIYFDNYLDACRFINKNWHRIDCWWGSRSTQVSRKKFVEKFCKKNVNILNDIQSLIDKC
jgi:putative transferase (TIGR04331 family)